MDQFNFVISVDKDTLDFWASVIRSLLSWPVAFLVALWIFYQPLRNLIERIRKAKLPGVELDVADTLVEADARAFQAAVDAAMKKAQSEGDDAAASAPEKDAAKTDGEDRAGRTAPVVTDQRRTREARLAEDTRRWGRYLTQVGGVAFDGKRVLDTAWRGLVGAVQDLYEQSGDSAEKPTDSERVAYLYEIGSVDDAFVQSWQKLAQLIYGYRFGGVRFTDDEAKAFASTAKTLQDILESQTVYPPD